MGEFPLMSVQSRSCPHSHQFNLSNCRNGIGTMTSANILYGNKKHEKWKSSTKSNVQHINCVLWRDQKNTAKKMETLTKFSHTNHTKSGRQSNQEQKIAGLFIHFNCDTKLVKSMREREGEREWKHCAPNVIIVHASRFVHEQTWVLVSARIPCFYFEFFFVQLA